MKHSAWRSAFRSYIKERMMKKRAWDLNRTHSIEMFHTFREGLADMGEILTVTAVRGIEAEILFVDGLLYDVTIQPRRGKRKINPLGRDDASHPRDEEAPPRPCAPSPHGHDCQPSPEGSSLAQPSAGNPHGGSQSW